MKRKPKPFPPDAICFIKENQKYRKMTCGELDRMKRDNPEAFINRWFIPVEGILLEVSHEDYKDYYRMKERWDYLGKLDKKNHPISFDHLPVGIKAEDVDVYKIFETGVLLKALRNALSSLNNEEKALIEALFFEEQSVMELSEKYEISPQTLYSKKRKILEKLRKMLEE